MVRCWRWFDVGDGGLWLWLRNAGSTWSGKHMRSPWQTWRMMTSIRTSREATWIVPGLEFILGHPIVSYLRIFSWGWKREVAVYVGVNPIQVGPTSTSMVGRVWLLKAFSLTKKSIWLWAQSSDTGQPRDFHVKMNWIETHRQLLEDLKDVDPYILDRCFISWIFPDLRCPMVTGQDRSKVKECNMLHGCCAHGWTDMLKSCYCRRHMFIFIWYQHYPQTWTRYCK